MKHCVVGLMLTLLGCGGGDAQVCNSACKKLQTCTGSATCALSATCSPLEQCLAGCINNSTCAAITGTDPPAALALKQCQSACGTVTTDGSPAETWPRTDAGGDRGAPDPDAGLEVDAAVTDMSVPKPDKFVPQPDQFVPQPDQFVLQPDQGMPNPDQGVPTNKWINIAAGSFSMGSPASEACREAGLKETAHQVTLTHGFSITALEVTQGQFLAQLGYNPSNYQFCGKDCPVEMVTWHEAVAYCNKLSANKGLAACYAKGGSASLCAQDSDCPVVGEACIAGSCTYYEVTPQYDGTTQAIHDCPGYRLPTEAEWEYAYRAGSTTAFHNGGINSCTGADPTASAIGWYDQNAAGKSQLVGQKQANAWGLYDMAGNVWEWVHDGHTADLGSAPAINPFTAPGTGSRIVRGGAWSRPANNLRAAYRGYYGPSSRGGNRGFRCVKSQ